MWLRSSERRGRCLIRREDADPFRRVRTLSQGGRSSDLAEKTLFRRKENADQP